KPVPIIPTLGSRFREEPASPRRVGTASVSSAASPARCGKPSRPLPVPLPACVPGSAPPGFPPDPLCHDAPTPLCLCTHLLQLRYLRVEVSEGKAKQLCRLISLGFGHLLKLQKGAGSGSGVIPPCMMVDNDIISEQSDDPQA